MTDGGTIPGGTPRGWDGIARIVGAAQCLRDAADTARYRRDWRGLHDGPAAGVVRPGTTAEVAGVLALCAREGWPVVPVGGNTGMVAGAVPRGGPETVIVSTERLTRIQRIDPDEMVAVVDAGVVLADLQAAAAARGCLFPVSLGAEGTCQVGGAISTNAGGVNVLRYGTMRDQVLGLEAVLPDGRVWNGLRSLRKDNTGYALKHLFAGAEGTLGIVTAAALKLYPAPRDVAAAMVAIDDPAQGVALLRALRGALGDTPAACEILPRAALDFATRQLAPIKEPFAARHPWHILVEATGKAASADLETALADVAGAGGLRDAVIAQSEGQRAAFWHLREAASMGYQTGAGAVIKHDIAVPVGQVPAMIDRGLAAVDAAVPGVRPVVFGHLGDGNLHFNLVQPEGMAPEAFTARTAEINALVHDIATALGGTISAEHGIGLTKVAELARRADPVERDLMRRIKAALDPEGRMNPGKLLPPAD